MSIIRTGLIILVELINLVNSAIIFLSQMTSLRWLTFLLGSQIVILIILLFWKNCSSGKTQLVSFDRSNNNGSIDVKMDGSVLEEKSSFKMLGLTFSSKLDWGSYIISIAKTASKKIGALIRSMKFLSPEVGLYLYKSTIRPCMEYCCHVWAGAPSCYLGLLDKLQKWICRIVGTSLADSLEPLAHH